MRLQPVNMIQKVFFSYDIPIKYNFAIKTVIVYLQVCDHVKLSNIRHIKNYSGLLEFL